MSIERTLSFGLSVGALALVTGCGAAHLEAPPAMAPSVPAMEVSAATAPAPPPAAAPAPAAPGGLTRGFAPPAAPADPSPRQPSAEALEVPAMKPPENKPAPAPAPSAKGPAKGAAHTLVAKAAPPAKPPPPPKAPPPPPPRSAKAPPAPNAPQGVPAAPIAPLLIYVGDLQMQLDEGDFAATLDKVIDIAESLGGYLAGRKDASVQVRIPSQRFRESLVLIEKIGDVIHRTVTADDVSEQYSDLEGRLVNLKATRHRLQEFLARSGSMADMLQVGRELERVAAEIEQIEGKMRYLRSRAAFSLVTVSLVAKPRQVAKIAGPKETPPPREADLPIDWLTRVNLSRLLNLRSR